MIAPLRGLAAAALLAAAAAARPDAHADAAIRALREDPSLKVRTQAALVLGRRGATEGLPALRDAVTRDGVAAVRLAAVTSLGKIGARAARPTLRAAREADPDPSVREAAARALEALGPVTVAVRPAGGTPEARAGADAALAHHLRALGFAVEEQGELRLEPTVTVQVSAQGERSVLSARASLAAVDLDGHLELLESSARAAVTGPLPDARRAPLSNKVVDAAVKGLCQELAARLGRR